MVIEKLLEVKAKIANPEDLVKGHFAKDADGNPVSPWNPTAQSWSIVGAVMATTVSHSMEQTLILKSLNQAAHELYGVELIADLEDAHSHEDIMKCFDLAADKLRAIKETTLAGLRQIRDNIKRQKRYDGGLLYRLYKSLDTPSSHLAASLLTEVARKKGIQDIISVPKDVTLSLLDEVSDVIKNLPKGKFTIY